MAEEEALIRKRKVRSAHRGSVTRIIGQVKENLETVDGPNLAKLRQQKLSLSGKVGVLCKLDEELLDMIKEDELEHEVEQADVIQERISLCVIDIDQALKDASDDANRSGSTVAPSVDVAAVAVPTTASVTHALTTAVATPTVTTGSVTITTASATGITTPSTRSGSAILTAATAPHIDPLPIHTHVRLPKLRSLVVTLPNGLPFGIRSTPPYMKTEPSRVSTNLNYLNSYLESEAANAISGLTLTAVNYEEAVATLKRRFGNKQLIVNRHMDLLLHLDTVASQHNLKALRHLFDIVESNVRGLRALGAIFHPD